MSLILFKPNPIIDGIFRNTDSTDYLIFNNILYNVQKQKANGDFVAIIPLDELKEMINDKNLATKEKIEEYLDENFRKDTIRWQYKDTTYLTGLITKIKFDKVSFNFYIHIDKDLVEFLLNYNKMKTGYTPLDLGKRSKSFYATRIYEHLRKWSNNQNTLTLELTELKKLLGIENEYSVYYDFKKRILNPSIKEIKNKFNMEVKFKPKKLGKKVVAIEFIFKDNEPRQYSFEDTENIIKNVKYEEIDIIQERLKKYNIKIAVSTTDKLKQKFGSEILIIKGIDILFEAMKHKKIKAPVQYLTGILENLSNENSEHKEPTEPTKTKFHNFEGREYTDEDYKKLEEELVEKPKDDESIDGEKILEQLKNLSKKNQGQEIL